MADDAAPPAAAPADAVEPISVQFFAHIDQGNVGQLRALIDSLDADTLRALLLATIPRYIYPRTGLVIAILRRRTEIVALLLEKGADPHQTTQWTVNHVTMAVTPLWAAVNRGDLEMCRLLITYGANVDVGTDSSLTPLLSACDICDIGKVTLLVENGADVNLGDDEGATPLMIASIHGRVEMVNILLSHHADVEQMTFDGTRFALMDAASRGRLEVVRVLVDEWAADVNKQASDGTTALISASCFGRLPVVAFLIERGADLDHTDMDGYNSLMWAVKNTQTLTARHLLEIGANADQIGIDGKRARDLAVETRKAEMVALFNTTAVPEQREEVDGQPNEQPQQQQH